MPGRRKAAARVTKPFDAATKHLLELDPGAWLAYLGVPSAEPISIIDSNLTTVVAEADKVVRVAGRYPRLVHIEFQATQDPWLGLRLLFYNAALRRRHRLAVQSAVVLLRPEADRPDLSGQLEDRLSEGELLLDFRYTVVRVWQQPVAAVLRGGLATLPLAPLSAGAEAVLPEVIRRMDERVSRETTPTAAAEFWTSTYLLMGLRYGHDLTVELLRGVRAMRESVTYQAIVAEGEARGRASEARRIVLRLGTERFGPPDRRVRATVGRADLDRLERLSVRLLRAASWDDLLAEP